MTAEQRERARAASTKYNALHREERRAADRKRYAENREKMLAQDKKYHDAHRERYRAHSRKHHVEHGAERREERKPYDKKRYAENRETVRLRSKKYYAEHREQMWASELKRKYGLTPERWEVWYKEGCWLCRRPFDDKGRKKVHVDHDHATGTARGLAHAKCNSIIGLADEDTNRLRQIADSLDRYRAGTLRLIAGGVQP